MAKLTLSSNKTDYTTWLEPPIPLEPGKQYEAAFLSLHTFNSIPNITEANNKFKYSNDKGVTWKIITLPKNAYEFDEISDEIKRQMKSKGDYDQINDKYYIEIGHFKFFTLLDISEDYMIDF